MWKNEVLGGLDYHMKTSSLFSAKQGFASVRDNGPFIRIEQNGSGQHFLN